MIWGSSCSSRRRLVWPAHDDTTSLGDWQVNLSKLPGGLDSLARKVEDIGMRFGIWIEPEMVSRHSDLFAQHPEWAIGIPTRRARKAATSTCSTCRGRRS